MTARTYAADDVPEINRNLARIRRNCFMKLFGSSTGCWCMGFYPDGTSASCNTAREPIGIEKPGTLLAPAAGSSTPEKTYCAVCTSWRLCGCTNTACPMPLPTDFARGVCSRFEALMFHRDYVEDSGCLPVPTTRWIIRGPKPICSCGHPENSASCDRWDCWALRR